MEKNNKTGFSIVEVLIVIAILSIIGLIGYNIAQNVMFRSQDNQATSVNNVPASPTINTVSDLNNAKTTLDDINMDDDSGDVTALNNQLTNF